VPEPAFDVPDSPPPLPVVSGATGKGDSPAAGGPAKSLDDLTGGSDAQYDAITKADLALTKQKIGAEGGMAAIQKRQDDAYAQRQERMLGAEGATMDDLKPWNAEKEMAKRETNLWEQFGSPGFVISMLASAFTAMPMNSALNAGAAAMNAINQGKMEDYHKAFDAWKENSNLTLKRLDIEEHEFNQIGDLRSKNMESWRAQATALAARFNDKRLQILLENGMDAQALDAIDAKAKSKVELADATKRLEQNNLELQIATALRGDSKDPMKLVEAKRIAETITEPGPKTPEQQAIITVMSEPGFIDLSSAEKQKKLNEAVAGVSQAKFFGHGGVPSMAKEETQLVEEYVKQGMSREDAIKKAKAAAAPPITGNKRVDLESHLGQYDDALKIIDGIDKTLNKYAGAAGVAGRATRMGERVGNILGSNNTDRVQMMRDIEQLQVMGPRLLLDQKTGRPLSIEAGKISDIIAGLNMGDTTANTLRAMKEIKERLTTIRDRDKAQMGGAAVADPPPVTEDKPWENDPIQK